MAIDYEQWCENNTNIKKLAQSLKSSLPEQYVGFYLHRVFGDEIEYQKQFDWLGRRSLDFFIPSLKLAVEYDGVYYHSYNQKADDDKTNLCKANDITLIRIREANNDKSILKKKNEIVYSPDKTYSNIANAIIDFFFLTNKKYNKTYGVDIDIERDSKKIISYVQNKYYKKTIAYVWPESKDYWLESKNNLTIFDVFYTDTRCFTLRCPHCGRNFSFKMKYYHNRKSLIPCECEYQKISTDLEKAIKMFKNNNTLISFDDSLDSRRLYDRIISQIYYFGKTCSEEELRLYKESGVDSPDLELFLQDY